MNKSIIIVMALAFFSTILLQAANAEDMTVDMLNKRDDGAKMVYSEDIARIDVGDTITWVPTSKGHNVHFIAGPDGWDLLRKARTTKKLQLLLTLLEYTCINVHPMQQWE